MRPLSGCAMNPRSTATGTEEARNHVTIPSLIKPYLQRLSGSPSWLDGILVERDLEPANSDLYSASPKSPKHVIVFRSGQAAKLEWTMHGSRKQALLTSEDAIINPA